MSDTETPITGTTESAPAPATADAAPSPAAAESAASAQDADGEEFLSDAESKPEAEAKGEDGKPKAKSEDEAKDFLEAETDDDEAKKEADAQGDAKKDGESETYQRPTLPEGMEIDDAAWEKALPVFADLGLKQDGVDKLVSLQAEIMKEAVEAQVQALADGHANTLKTWESELKAMPEYKGEALKQAKGRVRDVLAKLGTPELRQLLGDSRQGYGLVRNPHVFKFLDSLASKLSEDSLVRDDAGAPVKAPPTRDADILYS